jgi:cobalt-zinc-cadmium efflux system outer membrane protein
MLMIQQDQMLARQLLSYNKRLAVPDINLFASYDQRGGAFTNQINSGIAIPLPLWNRNQGNIRAMQYRIQETEYLQQAAHQETLNGLQNNFALYTQTVAEYQKVKRVYGDDFEITIKGMSDNFKKRNVSMIEFVDFFESYNQVLAELARMKTQLVTSAELLNLSVGKDIY